MPEAAPAAAPMNPQAQAAAVAAHIASAAVPPPAAPAAQPNPAAPAAGAVAAPAPAAQPAAPDPKAAPAAFDIATWNPKLPDGVQQFDKKALTDVHGIVFNEKLSPTEKMQALVDFQLRSHAAQQQALDSIIKAQREKDFEALRTDKDFGGARLEKTVQEAKDVMTYAFGEKGSKLLEAYGLDRHPDVVIPLARIRAVLSEDTIKGTVRTPPADPNNHEAQMKTLFPKSYEQMLKVAKKQA